MDLIYQLKTLLKEAEVPCLTIELKRNEFLKVKGSVDTNLYHINEGTLRVFMEDEFEEHTFAWAMLVISLLLWIHLSVTNRLIYTSKH